MRSHGLPADAGFGRIEAETRRLDLLLPPLGDFVPRHVEATPMAAGFAAASEPARGEVVEEVCERLVTFAAEQGARVPFATRAARA